MLNRRSRRSWAGLHSSPMAARASGGMYPTVTKARKCKNAFRSTGQVSRSSSRTGSEPPSGRGSGTSVATSSRATFVGSISSDSIRR